MGQRQPFHSIPLRRRRPAQPSDTTAYQGAAQTRTRRTPDQSYVSHTAMPPMPDDDQLYATHATPTSAIRYTDPYEREVFQQGRRRVVFKHVKAKRRVHWLFPAGLGMLAMLALMLGEIWTVNAWDTHQLDATYGFPRYYEVNHVVGHNRDSLAHPSHFIFENLDGHIFFVEIPAGDISKARIYAVSTLVGDDAANWPVTATFQDINHDGRLDLLIHIQDQTIVYLNDGSGFKPQQPQ